MIKNLNEDRVALTIYLQELSGRKRRQTIIDAILSKSEIYVENAKSILKYPEYRDVDKAREIFSFLEDKNNLKKLIVETFYTPKK